MVDVIDDCVSNEQGEKPVKCVCLKIKLEPSMKERVISYLVHFPFILSCLAIFLLHSSNKLCSYPVTIILYCQLRFLALYCAHISQACQHGSAIPRYSRNDNFSSCIDIGHCNNNNTHSQSSLSIMHHQYRNSFI